MASWAMRDDPSDELLRRFGETGIAGGAEQQFVSRPVERQPGPSRLHHGELGQVRRTATRIERLVA